MASLGRTAIKAGMDRLFEVYGTQAVKDIEEKSLGKFLAVFAFQYGKHNEHLSDEQVVRVIKQAKLKVRVESSGRISASVLRNETLQPVAVGGWHVDHSRPICTHKVERGNRPVLRIGNDSKTSRRCCYHTHLSGFVPKEEEPAKNTEQQAPVTIQNKQGTVIYNIQNLNVYLTVDMVHQLNVNPQQIINIIQEQIEKEIEKNCR